MHTKGKVTRIVPLISLIGRCCVVRLHFRYNVFHFVRNISDERFRVRMTSQAVGIRVIKQVL